MPFVYRKASACASPAVKNNSLDSTFTPVFNPTLPDEAPIDDFMLCATQIITTPSPLQDQFSRLAEQHHLSLAEPEQLSSLSTTSCKLSMKCNLGHRTPMTLNDLSSGCGKCASIFSHCKEFVKGLGGYLKNGEFAPVLNVQCAQGHEFLINYKSLSRKWCSICRKVKESTQKIQEQQRRQEQFDLNQKRQ